MNKTQKQIIGWALIAVGVLMVVGVAVNAYSPFRPADPLFARVLRERGEVPRGTPAHFDLRGLIVNPLFYLGVALAIGGVVILKGDDKAKRDTP